MSVENERIVQAILREMLARRTAWMALACVLSILVLAVGLWLPKRYTSYSSILVESENIMGPLMKDVAEQTDVSDLAPIVREIAFGRAHMEVVLEAGGWLEGGLSPAQKENQIERIIDDTVIKNQAKNLIGVQYTDIDPERAFLITRLYVDRIVAESRSVMRNESSRAFEFIDSQVDAYREKLKLAEEGLKEYRSENMDALPESASEVSARGTQLRREIDSMRLELKELQASERSLVQQVEGQAQVTSSRGQEVELRGRISQLQQELDVLRLNYHDTYPDIVRIKAQMASLEATLEGAGGESGSAYFGGGGQNSEGSDQRSINPLYEELRSNLSTTRTRIKTVQARILETLKLVDEVVARSLRIGDAEASLADLTRDYEVNRDIYQDLLRRRENARLSMVLDAEQQGINMRVQEPPAIPYKPTGIRFVHIGIAGLLLTLATPIVLSALLVQFDPRIRLKERLEQVNIPVIAVVPEMYKSHGNARRWFNNTVFAASLMLLVTIYLVAAWLRITGRL